MIDLWVGVFVAAGFAGLLFLALKVGNLASFSTNQTYQVNAKFANIGGLKVRGPVKSAGVVVGRVADIRFDNESFEAIVTMNVAGNYQFPRDTTASKVWNDASFMRKTRVSIAKTLLSLCYHRRRIDMQLAGRNGSAA